VKLEYFDNPFTAEKFEYSSKPIRVKVVQEDSGAQDRVKQIFSGNNHSIALTEMGKLWSWGLGSMG
jgi:alpha-tubulin suppressor-like RCC1 family protein